MIAKVCYCFYRQGIHGNDAEIKSSTYLIRGKAEASHNPKIQLFCRGVDILDAELFENYWLVTKDEGEAIF